MAKKKKTAEEQSVNIDGTEYKVSDLSKEQIDMVNHVADLDNKLRSASFNVVQLQGGRNYFMEMLNASLEGGQCDYPLEMKEIIRNYSLGKKDNVRIMLHLVSVPLSHCLDGSVECCGIMRNAIVRTRAKGING